MSNSSKYELLSTAASGINRGRTRSDCKFVKCVRCDKMRRLENINMGWILSCEGKYACTRTISGKACLHTHSIWEKVYAGTAAKKDETQLVKDVHEFPGHIACDSASRSEIVIPIHNKSGVVAAVLDIDSPDLARFDETDQSGLELCVNVLEKYLALLTR